VAWKALIALAFAAPLIIAGWIARGGRRRCLLAAITVAASSQAMAQLPDPPVPQFQHIIVGDPTHVRAPRNTVPSLVLMGGGRSVPDAFRWMIDRSRGGNFVVIRAAGTDVYNDYLYALGGISSVETLVIPSREAASDPFVIGRVRQADALFIAGGNQGDYVHYWKNTPLERAIHELAANNVPIAGFSAGLAILGEYAFTAEHGPIRSAAAMADPFDNAITLSHDFLALPALRNVITDSHFDTRDRMGRLITFMSRLVAEGRTRTVRGIGVSSGAALLIENGWAERVGEGSVYFLETTTAPEVLQPSVPLTHRDIRIQRLDGAGRFDMRQWSGKAGELDQYSVSVVNGALDPYRTGRREQ
jgi:cyanophycinase